MESSQKMQVKLGESIKEQYKNGGLLCAPIFVFIVFFIATYIIVERRSEVIILLVGGIFIQFFLTIKHL